MLRVTLQEEGNTTQVTLEGVIDESSKLDQLLSLKSKSLQIYSKKVTRINSVGIELWTQCFSELRKRGTQLQFFELSAVLVESNNFIAGFIVPEELKTLCVPYWCPNCKTLITKFITPEQVITDLSQVESCVCDKCQKTAEIDGVSREYFSALLLRKNK